MNDLFTFCLVVLVITGINVALKEQNIVNKMMTKSTCAPFFSLSERALIHYFSCCQLRLQVLITPELNRFHAAL